MPWDRVHAEAEVLEHVLSEELEELIAARLGDPTVDQHGDPIPTVELGVEERPTRSLDELAPGAAGGFVRFGARERPSAGAHRKERLFVRIARGRYVLARDARHAEGTGAKNTVVRGSAYGARLCPSSIPGQATPTGGRWCST